MPKRALITMAISTFLVFVILLCIGISLSAKDQVYDLESRVGDIEGRLN